MKSNIYSQLWVLMKKLLQFCPCQYWTTTLNEILSRRAASAACIVDLHCIELLAQGQRICQQLRLLATDIVKRGSVHLSFDSRRVTGIV